MNKYKDFLTTIKPFVDDVGIDVLGNTIAHKHGVGKRLILIAHHDVVRLMVTYIDERGFLYVKPAGGIDISILQARKVKIRHNEKIVVGIIGKKPIHLLKDDQASKITFENIWIDIGANDRKEAKELVSIGDYAYFDTEDEDLVNDLVAGAYCDNNAGLMVLMSLAEQIEKMNTSWDVFFVASNHEEIGMRGATVVSQAIQPEVCICIDVTHATDYPTMNVISDGDIRLGEGCVLAKGPNVYPQLLQRLEDIANDNGIKYQLEVSPYPTGTDANMIQLSGNGVKTAVVSIPCRYMHTPHEVCSKRDIECAITLIAKFLSYSK